MAVHEIRTMIICDGCAQWFSVEIDPAYKSPKDWSNFDIAEDAVRGGHCRVEKPKDAPHGPSSVQGGKMLCPTCTRKCDAVELEEERDLTEDEVSEALA